VVSAARRNPTRHELVERIESLIADYKAGSLNIDEYLRTLGLSNELTSSPPEDLSARGHLAELEVTRYTAPG
jgi:type I restriction enzyme R subunit